DATVADSVNGGSDPSDVETAADTTSAAPVEADPSGTDAGVTTQLVAASIAKDGESLIALSGLTLVSYGGYLNGESFQQDGILSHNGYQYTAFWNTNRSVVMARRELPSGEWQKFEFTDYTNTEDDAHNTISLGISQADGTLHLSFDHHGS